MSVRYSLCFAYLWSLITLKSINNHKIKNDMSALNIFSSMGNYSVWQSVNILLGNKLMLNIVHSCFWLRFNIRSIWSDSDTKLSCLISGQTVLSACLDGWHNLMQSFSAVFLCLSFFPLKMIVYVVFESNQQEQILFCVINTICYNMSWSAKSHLSINFQKFSSEHSVSLILTIETNNQGFSLKVRRDVGLCISWK